MKLILLAGLLFIVDMIWGLISLHQWIYLISAVAAFYLLAYVFQRRP